MVVKDVDSVMTCEAALAQMPKDETHFANTVPSSQSHCSHYQTKRGRFLQCLYFCAFIYIDIFLIFFTKLHYLHHSQYNTQFTVQAYI